MSDFKYSYVARKLKDGLDDPGVVTLVVKVDLAE